MDNKTKKILNDTKGRVCNVCGVKLVIGENWSEAQKKCGVYRCKECVRVKLNEWRHKNREKHNEGARNLAYKHGTKPMSENKECSLFLGVHVAERVLSNTFKDVTRMRNGNSGYDFICNKGKKIDVKSSCSLNNGQRWSFNINHNNIADYFLCIAFDDRDNLNPLYLWLIPSHLISDKSGITISLSTIERWDDCRLDIEKVNNCCTRMKTEA